MIENKLITQLFKKAEKIAEDTPVEDEIADCADLEVDQLNIAFNDLSKLVDFVLKNPNFAMTKYADGEFLFFWKTEASAIDKLNKLIAKAEKLKNKQS